MLKKTESIVVKCVKYRESSIIAHVFTPMDGIVPLIISGVRTVNNKGKAAQFQIGQILDVVYYDKQKEGVMRLKESAVSIHYRSIPFSITKIALTQYVIEVTRNTMYQAAVFSDDVYPWLKHTLLYLDETKTIHPNLAVHFVWNLIEKLGIAPNLDDIRGDYLNLQSGEFSLTLPVGIPSLDRQMIDRLKELVETPGEHVDRLELTGQERKYLLESGHLYLKLHLPYFRVPQSAEIYRDILRL